MFRRKSTESNVKFGVPVDEKSGGCSPNDIYSTRDLASGNKTSDNVNTKRRSSSTAKQRQNRGKKSPAIQYDFEEDDLNSDVASILNPLKQRDAPDSRNMENMVTYFTFFLIFLPSVLAVIVPIVFPNCKSKFDVADLITDILMIVLVSWFIKFSIEWPWKWLKEIKKTKKKLINYTNSTCTMNIGVSENSSERQLNDQVLTSNILLIRKLVKVEKIALFSCFSGAVVGSLLMAVARRYIIIEDTRKKIVFSNLNIGLFIFWEMLRLLLTITDGLQRSTVTDIQDRIKNHGNDYCLITEDTLDMYLPPYLVKKENNFISICKNIILKLKSLSPEFCEGSNEDAAKYEELKTDYEDKLSNLEKKNKDQNFLIEEILKSQNNEFTRINLSIGKIEKSLIYISKSTTNSATELNTKVYLKPFPLNLNLERNIDNASTALPLDTIKEENEFTEAQRINIQSSLYSDSSYVDTMFDNEQASNQRSSKLSPITMLETGEILNKVDGQNDLHFSLHGLPFTSTIKNIVSRDLQMIEDPLIKANINELVCYESDINSSNFDFNGKDPYTSNMENEDIHLSEFISILKSIYHKLSLRKYLKNRSDMKSLKSAFQDDIFLPYYNLINSYFNESFVDKKYVKYLFWEFSMKHIIQNIEYFNIYTLELYNYYISPVKRAETALLLIFTEIPFNCLRIYFNIIIFVPRVIVRFLIINSVSGKEQNTNQITTESSDPDYDDGMKEFHLVPNHSHTENMNLKYTKTRDVFANKISKHYDSNISINKPNDRIIINPVTLYDKGS